MKREIFFLLNFALLISSISEGNIWFTSYTSTTNSTEKVFVNFVTRGRFGFSMISLVHPNSTITGISYLESGTKRILLQVSGNFTENLQLPLTELNSTIICHSPKSEKVFGKLFNEFETFMEVPSLFASNYTKIFIGYHDTFKPVIGGKLPSLTQVMETTFVNETKIPHIPTMYNILYYSHLGIIISIQTFLVLNFIIAILLRNCQPLKSKGVIPFISMIILSINLTRGYFLGAPLSFLIDRNVCYIEGFTIYPGNFSMIGITVLVMSKFVILKNLNNRKERIYESKGENIQMNWFFRILKILNNNTVSFFIVLTLFIFQALCQAIILSIFKFECNTVQYNVSNIYYIVSIIFLVSLGVILVIDDIILNYKRLLTCDIISFWKEDLYYLRFETYILGITCSGGSFVIYVFLYFIADEPVSFSTFLLITYIFMFVFLIEFPIIVTIIQLVNSLLFPPKDKGDLTIFLKTEDGFKLMLETCKREYSIENISCWNDIQEFKKLKSLEERKKKINDITNLYLNGSSSELEINISNSISNEIAKKYLEGVFENEIFEVLERNLILNMNDTYMRLIFTKEFTQWQDHHKFLKESSIE